MTAHTTFALTEAQTQEHHEGDCQCGCGCGPEGCKLECLERPRYFCGQLLTDADLTALVDWARGRLGLVRYRDGWGVVCGLALRCDPRKPSSVEIAEGYAVSCCGSDIVVCEPAVVDLSDACRPPKSPCDDPCAPKPDEPRATDDGIKRSPWDCPEGVWVDLLIDAADEEAGGRPALATDGCRRLGTCEASRVRETYSIRYRRSAGDPLLRAETRWTEQYRACFADVDESGLPQEEVSYGDLRLAVEQFVLDHACEGGCRALRWMCPPGAPSDDTPVAYDDVQRVRLALLLDCLVALGRCGCHACGADTAVQLGRVLVVPGATEDCPCRVVAVDDVPPYRRPLGHDCPPARLGSVNLGDLIGQRPEAACLAIRHRGLQVGTARPVSAAEAIGPISRRTPIFHCGARVDILTVWDDCLRSQVVVGYTPVLHQVGEPPPPGEGLPQPSPATPSPLMRIGGMTARRIERLAERGVTNLDEFANADNADLRRAIPGTKAKDLEAMKEHARELAADERA